MREESAQLEEDIKAAAKVGVNQDITIQAVVIQEC